MSDYSLVKSLSDIDDYITKSNALHDGYIVAVEYSHNGITPTDFGNEFNPELTQLKIHVLITSMQDAVLEMVFDNILEWKITDTQNDIFEATVFDDRGWLVWTDEAENKDAYKQNGSYVVAKSMKWRFL